MTTCLILPTTDNWLKLASFATDIIKAAIVPVTILLIIRMFEKQIKILLSRINKFSGLGFEMELAESVKEAFMVGDKAVAKTPELKLEWEKHKKEAEKILKDYKCYLEDISIEDFYDDYNQKHDSLVWIVKKAMRGLEKKKRTP